MQIVPTPESLTPITRQEQEIVAQNKKEYTLLGSFARTRGMQLFSFCPQTNQISLLRPVCRGMANLAVNPDGSLTANQTGITGHINVADLGMVFEAVNLKSAQKRVNKFLSGKINTLNNLKPAGKKLHITDFL